MIELTPLPSRLEAIVIKCRSVETLIGDRGNLVHRPTYNALIRPNQSGFWSSDRLAQRALPCAVEVSSVCVMSRNASAIPTAQAIAAAPTYAPENSLPVSHSNRDNIQSDYSDQLQIKLKRFKKIIHVFLCEGEDKQFQPFAACAQSACRNRILQSQVIFAAFKPDDLTADRFTRHAVAIRIKAC